MKKRILNHLQCIILAFILFAFTSVQGGETHTKGELYINNRKINSVDTIINITTEYLFPLRTIFEELGAKVEWEEETESIYIDFNEKVYLCNFKPLRYIGDGLENAKEIYITTQEKKGSLAAMDYILLNPMGPNGLVTIINDRTYLYQNTAKQLMDYFRYNVEIDKKRNRINILKIVEPDKGSSDCVKSLPKSGY